MKKVLVLTCLLTVFFSAGSLSQPLPEAEPEMMGMDSAYLALADSLIETSIRDEITPGAVLMVLRDSVLVHRKAYGWMQKEPTPKEMSIGTIFDLASLTKPVATATAVMKLLEQGRLRLSDPISDYVPEYSRFYGAEVADEEQPRIVDLMTHTAGLPFYLPVDQLTDLYGENTSDSLMSYMSAIPFRPDRDAPFTYSCPSFIALQKVVEEVTGTDLAQWTHKHIFEPLGMNDTFYQPDPDLDTYSRIAPTEYDEEEGVRKGVVHDPIAREVMQGISGNAGLFSSGDDLAVFAAMMLNQGKIKGQRIMSQATVRTMTKLPENLDTEGRVLGWDLSSPFASNRGDLFGSNTYGHTGYTGTSIIIDPDAGLAVILLTNRVYPDDSTSVTDLRAKVANVVAASVTK